MRTRLRGGAGILVVAGALLLAACGGGGGGSNGSTAPPSATGTPASSATITITNFMYNPMVVRVTPGAIITVVNKDSATHTLTGNNGQFDTGDIAQGKSKTFKAPTKPGNYSYICNIHQFMKGTITVS